MNSVNLVGNLTRDPELRAIPSGTSVCELGLAVNERFKDSSGDWQERPNFFDITVWGSQGESCAKYLEKGRQVAVSGRLRWEQWENKDGEKRSKVRVVADRVMFLGGGQRTESPDADVPVPEVERSAASSADDDIPF